MQQPYDQTMHRIFVIDYKLGFGNDRRLKTHITYATSRKNAEHNTRHMERHERINIIKITGVVQDQDFHDRIDEALATLKENNDLYFSNDDSDICLED